ncbi:hypothetical protein ASG65_22860 [Bacillus sp. Leaf13]|nr:hypothetical protein ASG65_22860 [Bacillus sp. Leaf13]KRF64742.1 hypothetical protein ASG99_19270 [Bacillus sp. Soil768D1]
MKINIEIFRDMVKKSKVSKKVQKFLRENGDPYNFLIEVFLFTSNGYLLYLLVKSKLFINHFFFK